MSEPINGTVWRKPWPVCHTVTVVFLGDGGWGLMHVGDHMDKNLTAPIFETDITGRWIYNAKEIAEKTGKWERAKARLEVVEGDRA